MSVSLEALSTAWQFVVKRSLAHWRLLSSVLIGVVLASAILSGTVLYFDALRQLALKQELGKHTTTELDMLVQTEWGPTTAEEYARLSGVASAEFDARVAWMLRDRIRGGKSPTFFFATPGAEDQAGQDNSRTYFAFMPRLEQHVALLAGGRMPAAQRLSPAGEPPEVEAVVPQEAAQLFGLRVGDRLSAVPTSADAVSHVNVVISGLFERAVPLDEEFWHLEASALRTASGPAFRTVPLFIAEQTFLEVLGPALPRMASTYAWLLETDTGRVDAWNSDAALANLELMNRTLVTSLPSYGNVTSLDNALREYDRRVFFSKVPMFVVLTLMALVVLYYVTTLSALVVENRRSEVALLRSRGANRAQILTVFVLEGVMIAALAVVAAPLLAAGAISVLGLTPAFNDLTGGARLTVSITGSAYLLSALGGALSFVALIIPAVQTSRVDVIQQRLRSARPSRTPAFQRYYIDVLLLVVSIFLFRQLTEQGSVVATNRLGESTVNQLLLALPGLVLIASAMILLRLFPLVMNLASRVLSYALPAGLTMGVWQIARDPTHYARLSLLLILTAGLGIFASSFEATLDRSFEERALFSTGSDVRVSNVRPSDLPGDAPAGLLGATLEEDIEKAFDQVPGVELSSPVIRATGKDLTTALGGYEMFATDGDRFGEVAWFRDDFSDRPIKELLGSLEVAETPEGLALPADAVSVGVRVKADRLHPTVRLSARLRNADNEHSNFTLGTLGSGEWTVLEAPLDTGQSFLSSRPLTLVSVQLDETALDRKLLAGSVLIDEISVTTEAGGASIIEGFDDVAGWRVLRNTPDAASDELRAAGDVLEGESGSVLFFWGAGSQLTPRGIFYGPELAPLPVLASKGFVEATGHFVGEEFEVEVARARLPVKLVGIVDLFPTMVTTDKKLLVADLTAVNRYVNLPSTESRLLPIEVWISATATGPEREALVQSLEDVGGFETGPIQDRAARLEISKVDPLVRAGWSALLFIAFSAVLVLSCVGFLIHAYVSFRNREFQFALLRTVGFSVRQLISMVWLEQTLVVALGLALGTWMGGRLGATIMPFLGQNDFGGEVIPPFAIQVNWGALLLTYAAMLFVFGLITLGIIWFIRRISLHRVLRLGEV